MATETIIKVGNPRFKQLGDWPDYNTIIVADLPDEKYKDLIAIHEFVEATLCKHAGITAEQVDEFDSNWSYTGEPGDDPNCPYKRQHQLASAIEMLLCHELGLNWHDYNAVLNYLSEVKHGKE